MRLTAPLPTTSPLTPSIHQMEMRYIVTPDTPGPPGTCGHEFWEVGGYYRVRRAARWGEYNGTSDLDIVLPVGTPVVCESVVQRRMTSHLESPTAPYVLVRVLDSRDPTGNTTYQWSFWAGAQGSTRDFQRINNPLVILALAGAGLGI